MIICKKMMALVSFLTIANSGLYAAAAKTKSHKCLWKNNPICGAMTKLKPGIDLDYALKLSNAFVKVAKVKKLPVNLLVSIAMQESSFKLDAVRKVHGLTLEEEEYSSAWVATDFCLMQINASNIKRMKLDASRLITDAEYCITAGALILNDSKSRFSKKEFDWFSRYNAVSNLHRTIYKNHILNIWRQIDPFISEDILQQKHDQIYLPAKPPELKSATKPEEKLEEVHEKETHNLEEKSG